LAPGHGIHYATSAHDHTAVTGGAVVTRDVTRADAGIPQIPTPTGPHTAFAL
jgi:hypothetical protein